MASHDRKQTTDIDCLLKNAPKYDFHQLTRLISKVIHSSEAFDLNFVSNAAHSLQSTQISSLSLQDDDLKSLRRFIMCVNIFGLTGPSGVLPSFYTNQVILQLRKHDNALKNFFDIFHNRLLEFYHSVWCKPRLFMHQENMLLNNKTSNNHYTQALTALTGLGTKHLTNRMHFSDNVFIRYAGLISAHNCSASIVTAVIAGALKVRVEVIQLVAEWLPIPENEQSKLSSSIQQNTFNLLGRTAVVGKKILSYQNQFRLRLGPLSMSEYLHFLPTKRDYTIVCELLRFLVGMTFKFSFQLVLLANEVPLCIASSTKPLLLGQTTWLHSKPILRDVDDTILYSYDV